MFKSYWIIGLCPVVGYSVLVNVKTVKTIEDKPTNWKLIGVLFNTAIYLKVKNKQGREE